MSGCAQVFQARSNQSLLPEQKAASLALPSETAVNAHADVTTLRQHQIMEGFPYVNHQSIATTTEQHMHQPGLSQACKPAKQPFPVACGHCVSISLAVAAAITSHSPSPRNTHKVPTKCNLRPTPNDV
jgi:hypothetical protein